MNAKIMLLIYLSIINTVLLIVNFSVQTNERIYLVPLEVTPDFRNTTKEWLKNEPFDIGVWQKTYGDYVNISNYHDGLPGFDIYIGEDKQ